MSQRFLRQQGHLGGFRPSHRSQAKRSLGIWIALVASVLLVPVVGFVIAMFALVGLLIFGLEGKRDLRGLLAVIAHSITRLPVVRNAPSEWSCLPGCSATDASARVRQGQTIQLQGDYRMEALQGLTDGFAAALTPTNLFWAFFGVTAGTLVGVLPGLGPPATIAILLPLSVNLEPATGLIMMAGIYYGAKYGGSTTSILAQHPRGRRLGGDGDRRVPDGPAGQSRSRSRHRRDRLLYRRDRRA